MMLKITGERLLPEGVEIGDRLFIPRRAAVFFVERLFEGVDTLGRSFELFTK